MQTLNEITTISNGYTKCQAIEQLVGLAYSLEKHTPFCLKRLMIINIFFCFVSVYHLLTARIRNHLFYSHPKKFWFMHKNVNDVNRISPEKTKRATFNDKTFSRWAFQSWHTHYLKALDGRIHAHIYPWSGMWCARRQMQTPLLFVQSQNMWTKRGRTAISILTRATVWTNRKKNKLRIHTAIIINKNSLCFRGGLFILLPIPCWFLFSVFLLFIL